MNKLERRQFKIFLCHASGDKPVVRTLYEKLRNEGFAPWLDEKDVLPGHDWELEITKAMGNADIIIICLSNDSVTKRGYVQKEIKNALNAAEHQPEGTIFLIPLKLEECEVPPSLRKFQWASLSEQGGFERLKGALLARAVKLGINIANPQIGKVFAAGKAFFPLSGKSKEQAWKELTGMFDENARGAKSYIPGGHWLRGIERRRPDDISVGDIFKYTMNFGTEMYVQIVDCMPYESFAYDEEYMPLSGEDIDTAYEKDSRASSRARMEFILRSHPKATRVEIRRREKGNKNWIDKITTDCAQWAAGRLQFILTGEFWQRGEIMRDEITIKRDDSYRIDF